MLRTFSLALLLISSSPIWAWNSGTHRLIAEIAWQQLSASTQANVSHYLLLHPDSTRWKRNLDETQWGHAAFLGAATWPDDIRHDARFYDETSETPSPPIPGLSDTARHRRWHYFDRQIDGSPQEGKGVLDSQLPRLIGQLKHASVTERVYALPWVIHLIGEIHQPLHVGSNHDQGGTLFEVTDPAHKRLPQSSLHQWWDDLPAPPWLNGQALEHAAQRLIALYPRPPIQGDTTQWAQESFDLAAHHAYPDTALITDAFRANAQGIAAQRVVAAAYRLASILEQTFARVSRETASE